MEAKLYAYINGFHIDLRALICDINIQRLLDEQLRGFVLFELFFAYLKFIRSSWNHTSVHIIEKINSQEHE